MQIHFYIKFTSQPGEDLRLRLFNKSFSKSEMFPMKYLNASFWHLIIEEENLLTATMVAYEVELLHNGEFVRRLFSRRRFDLRKVHNEIVEFHDEITPEGYNDEIFETSAFRILAQPSIKTAKKFADKNYTVAFNVFAPALPEGKTLCISGTGKKLKNWNSETPLLMYRKGNHWSIKINLSAERSVAYKYAIYDTKTKKITQWEEGDNRILHTSEAGAMTVVHQYSRIPDQKWKGAGIAIPLFSIRTQNDWGCGDFSSVKTLADWCVEAGFSLIQLLPLNDTTVTRTRNDSYSYAPISAFALHPIFFDLNSLSKEADIEIPETIKRTIEIAQVSGVVDYEQVLKVKWEMLRLIFEKEGNNFRNDYEWSVFFENNREWLVPYAVFSVLRDHTGTADFSTWGEWSVFDKDKADNAIGEQSLLFKDVSFYFFIQYHLHLQLRDAIEYLNRIGIVVKGDLTVGVARHSVDTWMYPRFFNMKLDYGAPPDAFSDWGQNWKFPVYNLTALEEDDFGWLKKRLRSMENYFQAVRIDHVLGLLRMFCIPHQSGNPRLGYFDPITPLTDDDLADLGLPPAIELLGRDEWDDNAILLKIKGGYHFRMGMNHTGKYKSLSPEKQYRLNNAYHFFFFSKQDELWKQTGKLQFQQIKSATEMLVCAEDLGMTPTFLPAMLNEFNILSLMIQRMPAEMASRFSTIDDAGYLSVVTTGTHDMQTLREWWESDRENIQHYYNYVLGISGMAPYHCEGNLVKEIIKQHLKSPAMWTIFPLQDILAMNEGLRRSEIHEERINDPANAAQVWNYRVHLNVEQLISQKVFTEQVAEMIHDSGR